MQISDLEKIGHRVGLIDSLTYQNTNRKQAEIEKETQRLEETILTPNGEVNARLAALGSAEIKTPTPLAKLLRRPELSWADIQTMHPSPNPLSKDASIEVEIGVKYAGYIRRQEEGVNRLRHLEKALIPNTMDYSGVRGLSSEVQEKLITLRPRSLGQASRIPGVTPAALSLLAVHLKRAGAS